MTPSVDRWSGSTKLMWGDAEGAVFVGRNGTSKCHGIEIQKLTNQLADFQPVTSKDVPGNCHINLPACAAQAFVAELLALFPPPTIQVWAAFYCEDKIEEYEFKNQDELDGWLRGIDAAGAENARWFKTKKEASAFIRRKK